MFTVEYEVPIAVDGTTPAPTFSFDPSSPNFKEADADGIVRFTAEEMLALTGGRLGVIDPDFDVGGTFSDRFLHMIEVRTSGGGAAATIAVVDARDDALAGQEEILASSPEADFYTDDCVFVPQGSALALAGFTPIPDVPVVIRINVVVWGSIEDYATLLNQCCCENVSPIVMDGYVFTPTAFYNTNNADLGLTTERWGSLYAENVVLAGADFSDAAAGFDDLVIGDGAGGSAYGMTFHVVAGTMGGLAWNDGTNVLDGGFTYDGSEFTIRVDNVDRLTINAVALLPSGVFDLGTTASRFQNGFIDTVLAAGAVQANADVGADDVVVGDQSGDVGMTLNMGGNTGEFAWASVANQRDAAISYDGSRFLFRSQNSDEMILSAAALTPFGAGGLSLGTFALAFSSLFSGNAMLAGADVGNAPAASNDLIIGDGAATDYGLTIFTGLANQGWVNFTDVGGATRAAMRYDHGGPNFIWSVEATDELILSAAALSPNAGGGLDLGLTGTRWGRVWAADAYLAGALAVDADVTANVVIIGDGTAATGITIFAGAGNNGTIAWNDGVNVRDGAIRYIDTVMVFRASNADRAQLDSTAFRPHSNNGIDLGSPTRFFAESYVTTMYVAGADALDAVAGAADLVIGDGTGGAGITAFLDIAGIFAIEATDVAATSRGKIRYQDSTGRWTYSIQGTDKIFFGTTRFAPQTSGYHLGATGNRFGEMYGASLLLADADLADAVAGAADLVIGDGSGNPGLTLFADNVAGISKIEMIDTLATAGGSWRYEQATEKHVWAVAGTDELRLTSALIGPTSGGGLDLGSTGGRWADGYINVGYFAGATSATPSSIANDIAIGTTSEATSGITIQTSTVGTGALVFNDANALTLGAVKYAHNVNELSLFAAGQQRLSLSSSVLFSETDAQIALGASANRFSDGYINTLYLAGAEALDAPAGADELVIGDGLASYGMTIFSSTNSIINMTDAIGAERGVIRYDHAAERFEWEANGSYFLNMNSAAIYPETTGITELGTNLKRWERLWATDAYLGGAASGDAHADADDLVIGAVEAVDHGLTIVSTADSWLQMNGAAGTLSGGFRYVFGSVRMEFYAGGVNKMSLSGASLRSSTDGALDLGNQTTRWGDIYSDGFLVLAGAEVAEGVTGADELVIGDGSGSVGLTLFTTDIGGVGRLDVTDVAATVVGSLQYAQAVGWSWFVEGTQELNLTATDLSPETDGGLDLGGSANRWAGLFAETGDFNGNLTLNSAGPTFRMGNGTGVPFLIHAKGETSVGVVLDLRSGGIAAGDLRWRLQFDGSEGLSWRRFDAGGSGVDNPLVLDWATGLVSIANDLTLDSANPLLTVGDSTGKARVRLVKGGANEATVEYVQSVGSDTAGDFRTNFDSGEAFRIQRYNASWEETFTVDTGKNVTIYNDLTLNNASPMAQIGSGAGAPTLFLVADAANVGRFNFYKDDTSQSTNDKRIEHGTDEHLRFQNFNGATWDTALLVNGDADVLVENQLLVAGAAAGDAIAQADDLIVGGGADAGLTIHQGANNNGRLAWNNGTNDEDGAINYGGVSGAEKMMFRVRNSNELTLNHVSLFPVTDGGLRLGNDGERFDHGYLNAIIYSVEPSASTITVGSKTIIMVDATLASVTVNMPTAVEGMHYEIIVLSAAFSITLAASGGDLVNGSSSKTLTTPGRYFITAEDATDWWLHGPVSAVA